MGIAGASDALIIANVNNIAATLVYLTAHAMAHGDEAWLDRHEWWRVACNRLLEDEPSLTLDG